MTGARRGRTLPRSFYARDSLELAPALLNKVLALDDQFHGRLSVRLVEVEAYRGAEDAGSHAYRGRTPRNTTMFGPPGHLYVYFSYGTHWCVNVVCGEVGVASAVLLRGAAPLAGLDVMRARRVRARRDVELCSGPGKLAQALGFDRSFDGADLVRGAVRVLDDGVPPPARPAVSPRVGLGEGRGDDHLWRFAVPGDPNVSRPRPVPPTDRRAPSSATGRAVRSGP